MWVLVADTEDEAWHTFTSREHWKVGFEKGLREPLRSPEEVETHQYTAAEQKIIEQLRQLAFVGTAQDVATKLQALVNKFQLDELVVVTWTFDTAKRHRSYELLAEAMMGNK